GQGASLWEQLVYDEETYYWGVPGVSMGVSGVDWVGPSLMTFGSEEQKNKYIPLISSGEPDGVWCTGYSEPNAGSDFANIQTRAVREGDEYVINGQKIWTSAAHRARWCWLATRTDFGVSKKHQGITIFIVDMKSPGVKVNPLINYAGYHIFNEVFFDDVRVPVSNLVGEENRGWYHLMQSLAFERGSVGSKNYGCNKRILDELVQYVRETQLSQNPIIRQKLADRAIEVETSRMFAYETVWRVSQGATVTCEAARDKAYSDQVGERLAVTGTEILGVYSQVDPHSRWAKVKGSIQLLYLFFPGMATAAGTDDIEKNVIAQLGLGLPRSY
ncbi:MAG: acyl-CoA dehydrogenase family protein, partial [Chloroflexota bacterium]|nr:acyl-CoA dehydrogenase family protein [Chloroflexota bacterium]